MTTAIQTRDLTHRFGRYQALDGIDLDVPEGGLYAMLGPNGAGKTTLMRILQGLLKPTSGEVQIRGRPLKKLSSMDRAWFGYVAEGQPLPGWMRVAQFEAYLAPLYPTWDHGLADHLRARFRLDPQQKIKKLSRGERMKIALLTALAPRPEVLLMDEPFSGMDALVKDELVYGLLEMAQSGDWTVLVCSHDIGELEVLADWVGVLEAGRLILSEPLELLRSRFRRVEVTLNNGTLLEMSSLPPTWLAPKRAGQRLSFVTCEYGSPGWKEELETALPEAGSVEIQPAGLREVFVSLASERMAGQPLETKDRSVP